MHHIKYIEFCAIYKIYWCYIKNIGLMVQYIKLEILQSLGGLYDGLAFYALHWSYAPSL